MDEQMNWQDCQLKITHAEARLADAQALQNWLLEQTSALNAPFLLAFAQDGVIWGGAENGMALSGSAYPQISPPLDPATLISLRLFGPVGEALLWRDEGVFKARVLREGEGESTCFREYEMLLWGTADELDAPQPPFRLYREGAQGFLHAPPVDYPRAALTARDYLAYDQDTGQAYVRWNRLVGLVNKEGGR